MRFTTEASGGVIRPASVSSISHQTSVRRSRSRTASVVGGGGGWAGSPCAGGGVAFVGAAIDGEAAGGTAARGRAAMSLGHALSLRRPGRQPEPAPVALLHDQGAGGGHADPVDTEGVEPAVVVQLGR